MRSINRVTAQQAEQYINTHYGNQVNKLEINYGTGKRIEYFKNGRCVGSYVFRFEMLEYAIN